MISDTLGVLIGSAALILITLFTSFTYSVTLSKFLSVATLPEKDVSALRNVTNLIQIVGTLELFGLIITSAIMVSQVKMTPALAAFGIIVYFVAIFLSMAFSNIYYCAKQQILNFYPEMEFNTYFDWIGLHLPWIIAITGFVLMIFAWVKKPHFGAVEKPSWFGGD